MIKKELLLFKGTREIKRVGGLTGKKRFAAAISNKSSITLLDKPAEDILSKLRLLQYTALTSPSQSRVSSPPLLN
jgi:hypothetical protein